MIKNIIGNFYIFVYPGRYTEDLYFQGKKVVIRTHAIKRARKRKIAYPNQVYNVLQTGKVKKFGKRWIKFTKKGRKGSIICVGEDTSYIILIKTIERGN